MSDQAWLPGLRQLHAGEDCPAALHTGGRSRLTRPREIRYRYQQPSATDLMGGKFESADQTTGKAAGQPSATGVSWPGGITLNNGGAPRSARSNAGPGAPLASRPGDHPGQTGEGRRQRQSRNQVGSTTIAQHGGRRQIAHGSALPQPRRVGRPCLRHGEVSRLLPHAGVDQTEAWIEHGVGSRKLAGAGPAHC